MAKPFDATLRYLVEANPVALLDFVGVPAERVELLDSNLSTVTSESDAVIRVLGEEPFLVHLEFQSSYRADMRERLVEYSGLLLGRYSMSPLSVVILLRREADGPAMRGPADFCPSIGRGRHYLEFDVCRVWERETDDVLNCAAAETLPFAPLTDVTDDALPGVIQRMRERILTEVSESDANDLWTASFVLMGLKYRAEFTAALMKGVRSMQDSVTYQAIIREGEAKGEAKGKAEEARRMLQLVGSARFGPVDSATKRALDQIADIERLESLAIRVAAVESWSELLA